MLNVKQRNDFWQPYDMANPTDIKRSIINVDSRFKENASDTPSNFHYRPATPLKNIMRLKLVSCEIPNIWYAFSAARENTSFNIILTSTGQSYKVIIDDGNYSLVVGTSTSLLDAIQQQLDIVSTLIGGGMNLQIQLDPVALEIVIFDDSATPQEFQLDFRPMRKDERPNDWGLGYYLGFRGQLYGLGSRYISEAPPDVHVDTYVLIAVNDYEIFQQSSASLGIFCFAKLIIHEDKYNIIFADDGSDLYTKEYMFAKPTNIPRFHIRLMDMYGHEIDMRQVNVSYSFEVSEITNATIYEKLLRGNP
jgi:hypothetical protein